MPPASRGCDFPCGTRPATAASCSRRGCRRRRHRRRAVADLEEEQREFTMTLAKLRWFVCTTVVVAGVLPAWPRLTGAVSPTLVADTLSCDMAQYKSSAGMTAAMDQNVLTVAWHGQNGSEMRTRYAVDGGQPIVRELAVRKSGGSWVTLGQNLTPEYHFVS